MSLYVSRPPGADSAALVKEGAVMNATEAAVARVKTSRLAIGVAMFSELDGKNVKVTATTNMIRVQFMIKFVRFDVVSMRKSDLMFQGICTICCKLWLAMSLLNFLKTKPFHVAVIVTCMYPMISVALKGDVKEWGDNNFAKAKVANEKKEANENPDFVRGAGR